MKQISEFQGQYRWLSNFWAVPIRREGRVYPSVEHAYMAAKSDGLEWKAFCASTPSPGVVKRASKNIDLVAEWDTKKLDVMLECLREKFTSPPMRALLLNTRGVHLQEGNRWGDTFWGVDLRRNPPVGSNHLGRLLMQVREELERF